VVVNLDQKRREVMDLFARVYGAGDAMKWLSAGGFSSWRARNCGAIGEGTEWIVRTTCSGRSVNQEVHELQPRRFAVRQLAICVQQICSCRPTPEEPREHVPWDRTW